MKEYKSKDYDNLHSTLRFLTFRKRTDAMCRIVNFDEIKSTGEKLEYYRKSGEESFKQIKKLRRLIKLYKTLPEFKHQVPDLIASYETLKTKFYDSVNRYYSYLQLVHLGFFKLEQRKVPCSTDRTFLELFELCKSILTKEFEYLGFAFDDCYYNFYKRHFEPDPFLRS